MIKKTMLPLTERQKAVYDWMVDYRTQHGNNPTVREIAEEFGISSPNGVVAHLRAMEAKGWIARGVYRESRSWGPVVFCRWSNEPPVDGLYVCRLENGCLELRTLQAGGVVGLVKCFGPIEVQ